MPCLFNEVQQAQNRASVLHHESFLRYWDEVYHLELEVKELSEKRDMNKCLSEQHEGPIKDLQAGLDEAQREALNLRREHADLVEKVQQKIERIDQLQAKMNEVQAMTDGWKRKMDRLASEKETAQAQLASVEVQLQVAKEKANKWSQLNNELRSQLSSALAERDALGKECEAIKSQLCTTSADAEEMVAQYRADVEAAEAHLKTTAEYVRRLSRRETLEEIHARGFDKSAEIEEAKRLEVKAKKLAEPEDEGSSEGSEEPEGLGGSGDEAGSGEDQA
ncbi:uncharacterized protein [Nicotiana tomentosiformis]|uniref:uncharacterized protein n=1 Tax=Nicotiana tomentosiformis TaxID=4098 RepID=UPI00051C72F7|nr:S-antigen protein-like isoform X1 [Nicotiana tomentosiformis]